MKKYQPRFFIPNNPLAPRISPEVAKEIGLNESLILLQLEYWMSTEGEERDGYLWTRKTVREIQDTFVFWGVATVSRTLGSLSRAGYIVLGDFDEGPGKGGSWIRFNLEKIAALESVRLFQDGTTVVPNNRDFVPDRNNRPYIEDQDIYTGVDKKRSSTIAARSNGAKLSPLGRKGRSAAPAPQPFPRGFQVDPAALAQVKRTCPDIDIDLTITSWKGKRISSGAVSVDWSADFVGYASTCQANHNARQKEREERFG
jgi:hypothetical protein